MAHIKLLETETAEKIAAGEVIERPSSVVKELTENAIDSGASSIFVDLEDGGHALIRITDNGSGIAQEDLPLAVRRFATSKISEFDDIFSLSSLGFRGEALASIGAVARLEIISRQGDELANSIVVEGSEIKDLRNASGDAGTSVIVTKLFYNTPARKKFQKSPANEISHIIKFLSHIAVLHRNIHFRLKNNNRVLFNYPEAMTAKDCLANIWNLPDISMLSDFSADCGSMKIEGILASPEINRSSRGDILFSVNGRIVKNVQLSQAVIEGFSPFLQPKRYPLAFISLFVPPDEIDVNVHPAKTEINFENGQSVFSFIMSSVSECVKKFRDPCLYVNQQTETVQKYDPITGEVFDNASERYGQYASSHVPKKQMYAWMDSIGRPDERPSAPFASSDSVADEERRRLLSEINEFASSREELHQEEMPINSVYIFEPLCQLFDTYIAAKLDGEFILIDQHAAHEKIIYEKLVRRGEKAFSNQMLLFPEVIELSPERSAVMKNNSGIFSEMGLDFEEFGKNTFRIRSLPFFIEEQDVHSFVIDILDSVRDEIQVNENLPFEKLRHIIACRSAIKANHKLSYEEMKALFDTLMTLKEPFFCPHGRPVVIKFSKNELEKMFKRK